VDDINDIVRKIRFEGCKALWRTLAKYKLHKDEELFETCVEPVETRRMGM
jgi:hypothetical protein